MRIVTHTTLCPNADRPNRGIFVENRPRKLVAEGRIEARVIASVPWFPFTSARVRCGFKSAPATVFLC